mgnify:FL=1
MASLVLAQLREIPISDLAAGIWRGVYFTAAVWVLGKMVKFVHWPGHSLSRRILMTTLALIVARTAYVNYVRFDGPVFYVGLPIDSLVLLGSWMGLQAWRREPGGPHHHPPEVDQAERPAL